MIQPEITRKLKFSDFVNKINLYKAHKQGGDRVVSAASTGVKLWYVVFCCIYLLGIYSNFFSIGGWVSGVNPIPVFRIIGILRDAT